MITGVVIAKKADPKTKACIKQLGFCDEVLVFTNDGDEHLDFSAQRNKALKTAKNDWLLYVDTDETISKKLQKEILKTVQDPKYGTYRIKRHDEFWGKPVRYGEVLSATKHGIVRLVRKDAGIWKGRVHEEFSTSEQTGVLQESLQHKPHDSIARFLEKINFYSTLRAEELYKAGKSTSALSILFVPIAKFLYSFFILMGIRDRERGFIYSFMMSFHSFLVRSKLHLLHNKN